MASARWDGLAAGNPPHVEPLPSAYLAASDLPARWQLGQCPVVLDTGFASADRFIACWQAWREALPPPDRSGGPPTQRQLHFIAIAPHMPGADVVRGGCAEPMADALVTAWPPAVPGLHRLAFDGGDVQLLVAAGSVRSWLPQLTARVDAFFIDADTLRDDADPAWPLRLFKAAGRLAAAGATLAMPAAGNIARSALRTAGFRLSDAAGNAGNPTGSTTGAAGRVWRARHAPEFTPRRAVRQPPATAASSPLERRALIIGAGLAGCATAWALAERGWHSTLLDRHHAPACGASGNPAGLFHGVVHPQDGAHARFNRAAALETQRAVRIAIDRHGVPGDTGGLLRLETASDTAASAAADAALQAIVRRSGLPADYVRAVSAVEASALAGIPIAHPCWYYPGGGWVQPAGLARSFIERGGSLIRFRGSTTVASLRLHDPEPVDDGAGARHGLNRGGAGAESGTGHPQWQLFDAAGRLIGESAVVVLAHAGDASVLTGERVAGAAGRLSWRVPVTPLDKVRGQLSQLSIDELAWALPGLVLPKLPLTGAGWLLPAVDGSAIFGATAQVDDADPTVRGSDHAVNLAALDRLLGLRVASVPPSLQGRTAWRCVARDRLPLIGAVPAVGFGKGDDAGFDGTRIASGSMAVDSLAAGCGSAAGGLHRTAQLPGLYTFTALGSRGIGWAALGGQVLASLIADTPLPIGRGLLKAVDPGRFVLRQRRRQPRR